MNKKKYFLLLFIVSCLLLFLYSNKIFPFKKDYGISENLKRINTAYYDLSLRKYQIPVFSKYGAIDSIDNEILYVSGESDFYLLKKVKNNNLYAFKSLSIEKINNNKDSFIEKNKEELGSTAEEYFGVKDILIEKFDAYGNKLLLISSLKYIEKDDCYNLSVYLTEIVSTNPFKISSWKNIFSSKNCLSINLTQKPKFAGASAGGRLTKLDNNNILLSVGDFYADGYNGPVLSQDLTNDYGKILKIDISDGSYKIFSIGHRNPQGLFVDKSNNIFSTEHGPDGGDEINLIFQDKNYGWPVATFGTAHGKKMWPIDKTNNTHSNFEKPIFSWGNIFGISNLIIYEDDFFTKWNNNLIVSTLASKQLVRLVFDQKKKSIIYIEYIPIGKRIRDIIKLDNGRLVLLTDRVDYYGSDIENGPQIILIDKYGN